MAWKYERKLSDRVKRELSASNFPPFYQQGLETSVPLSNAIRFYPLKPNPTFGVDREIGANANCSLQKRTVGVYVFFVLPTRPRNFGTVTERDQVLPS